MAYYDVFQAVQQYGDVLNKGLGDWGTKANKLGDIDDTTIYGRTQPWRGPSTFTGSSSRNIYGNVAPDVYNPMSMYEDWKPSLGERGLSAISQFQLGEKVSPFVSGIMEKGTELVGLDATSRGLQYVKHIGVPGVAGAPGMAATGKVSTMAADLTAAQLKEQGYAATTKPGGGFGLTAGMMLKKFTSDQNPYTYTGQEKMGDVAGNALIANYLAKSAGMTAGSTGFGVATGMNPYVAIASFLYSLWQGKRKKKKAKRLVQKAVKEVETGQAKGYKERSESLATAREEYLSDWEQQQWETEAGRYSNQYGGAYNLPYGRGDEGMKFTPKELKKISKAGRFGDTQLMHVNPEEAQLLRSLGGSGTINPYTGLPEYHWKMSFSHMAGHAMGGLADAGSAVMDFIAPVITPIFDAVGNIIEPVLDTATENVIKPVMKGAGDLGTGLVDLMMQGAKTGTEAIAGVGGRLLEIPVDILSDLLSGSGSPGLDLDGGPDLTKKRAAMTKDSKIHPLELRGLQGGPGASGLEKSDISNLFAKGFRGELDNPFIRENVLELAHGGKMNTVAEFTGNELIVNDQSTVEKGLAKGNYSMAANPIRKAMQEGFVTPGFETHQGNPLPVDDQGNIYAAGGALPFKVNKGAGVYDSATDQFSPTMTDKEIAMVAKKNIAKWKSNNMA